MDHDPKERRITFAAHTMDFDIDKIASYGKRDVNATSLRCGHYPQPIEGQCRD